MFINRRSISLAQRSTSWAWQRGDTIVEVLISIAVVSVILGGAYVVSNTSLQATRAAQERGNGLKLAESQLEQLKGLISTNSAAVFGGSVPTTFCISSVTSVIDASPLSPSKALCAVDTTGAPTVKQPQYVIAITRSGNAFTLDESWVDVDGRNTDKLQLVYRDYQ